MDSENQRLTEGVLASPSFILAEEDHDLLKRDELRPVRLQLELLKPELALLEYNIHSTIVVFGGARILERSDAERLVAAAKSALADGDDKEKRQILTVAERLLAKADFYDHARELGKIVSSTCQIGGRCDFVVVTGGGPGIMEAVNRGAHDVGAKSIGYNITLPHEQAPNPYITPELCFQFRYFAIRKMHFLMRAKALVAFPGGFGTLDELFEALTLIQTGKTDPIPVILFGREFWDRLINWQGMVDEGVISPGDLDLIQYAETAPQAWEIIEKANQDRVLPPQHP